MGKIRAIAVAVVLLSNAAQAAETQGPAPPQAAGAGDATAETKAVQAFGEADLTCAEWSDGCIVCVRGAACSLPGIACQPKQTACTGTVPRAPAK